jgi:hypothetical protein
MPPQQPQAPEQPMPSPPLAPSPTQPQPLAPPPVAQPFTPGQPLPPTPKKSPLKLILKLLGVIFVLFIIVILFAVFVANSATKAPQKISDEFISDVFAGKTDAAYMLTSKVFQKITTKDSLDSIVKAQGTILKGKTSVTNRAIYKATGQPETAVLVYSDKSNDGNTYYIKTEMQKNDGVWQVASFRSDTKMLDDKVE